MGAAGRLIAEGLNTQRAAIKNADTEVQRIQQAEKQRSYLERNLGTDAQFNGSLQTIDPSEADYTGRWQYNTAATKLNKAGVATGGAARLRDSMQARVNQANSLMDQAQAAAKAGNAQEAARLKAQAQGYFSDSGGYTGTLRKIGEGGAISFADAQADQPASALLDPQAQIVGEDLRRARQLQNWDSGESQDFRRRLGEGAHRSLDVAARENARQSLIGARTGGAATNSAAERLLQQRSTERLAAGHAQVESEVANQFENFRNAYAKDSVGFAQNWLDNKSGIRQEFLGMMTQAGLAKSQIMMGAGGAIASEGARQKADNDAKSAARKALLIKGATVLGSLVAGGAGAAFGGAGLLGSLGAGLNSATSAMGGGTPTTPPAPKPSSFLDSLFG